MTARTKAQRLATAASQAAEVRAYQTHPDVVALRVERIRLWVDRLIWTGMVLGLLFTMTNVASFAEKAAGATVPPWAPGGTVDWAAAWLLDPTVSLVLVGVLVGEQVINRHKLKAGGWVRAMKWTALAATYAMNTWSAWAALDPALILLHSVPPSIVFCTAEAVTDLRHQITEAVNVAYRLAADRTRIGSIPPPPPLAGETAPPLAAPASPPAGPANIGGTVRSAPDQPERPDPARRPDRGHTVPPSARTDRPRRTIGQLRSELHAAIEQGRIDPAHPTAESIRRVLRIGPARARQLRDELTTPASIEAA